MYHLYRDGWIEVICGCMFAGKTEELIRRINVLSYAKKDIMVFKPKIDNRYSDSEIAALLSISPIASVGSRNVSCWIAAP